MSAISRYQIYHFLIINSWENGQNVSRGNFFWPKNAQNGYFEGFWRQVFHIFYYFHNSKVKNKFPKKYLGGICRFTNYFRKNVGQNFANLFLGTLQSSESRIIDLTALWSWHFFLDNFSFQLATIISDHKQLRKWAKDGI